MWLPEKIGYAIDRYQKETRRLLEAVNLGRANKSDLAGEYSLTDIATFAWVMGV